MSFFALVQTSILHQKYAYMSQLYVLSVNSFAWFLYFLFTHSFQFKTRMRKTGSREDRDSEAIHYGNVDTLFNPTTCKYSILCSYINSIIFKWHQVYSMKIIDITLISIFICFSITKCHTVSTWRCTSR